MENIAALTTEKRNPATTDLDIMSALEIAQAMNRENARVPEAIEPILPRIAEAITAAEKALGSGGRLFYVGAGTSGRMGVIDASECPPTFGVAPDRVIGIIAGGDKALRTPAEGVEDRADLGEADLKAFDLQPNDFVVGVAASGRTPYVLGALEYARSVGCTTGAVACSGGSRIGAAADIAMEAVTGPEVLSGSTRLKAGTAQKLILNMITTAAFVRLGKAYQNLMVDMVPSNEKLQRRAENIVMEATGETREAARKAIDAAGNTKLAIVMILTGKDADTAKRLLDEADGHVRAAVEKA